MNIATSVVCPISGETAEFYCNKEGMNYYINRKDEVIFLSPMPDTSNMMEYANDHYKEGVYSDYLNAKSLKILTADIRLDAIEHFKPGKKMLDIGCSAGFFIEAAHARGYDVNGIEFASAAIEHAAPSVKNKIVHGDVHQELQRWQDDIDWVSAFDIIEHVHEPVKFLRDIKKMLKPRGLLVLSTPDTGHILRKVMGSKWSMLQPFQHTVLFSRPAMQKLLEKEGFVDVIVKPAYKYLTLSYLAAQLSATNKMISALMKIMLAALPTFISERPFSINIGEFIIFARKPS